MTGIPEFSRSSPRVALARAAAVAVMAASLAGCGSGPRLAPTPNLYATSNGTDPFESVPEEFQTSDVVLIYATDRVPEPTDDGSLKYGYRRSRSLAMGQCTVRLGDGTTGWSALVEASRATRRPQHLPMSVTAIEEFERFPAFPVPPAGVVDGIATETAEVLEARTRAVAEAQAKLIERLAHAPRKEAFLFVHGYNNTFEEAAFRIAQLWHFMGRTGVPLLYSWPAGRGGALRGYTYDRESGEFTVYHLKNFIQGVARCPSLEKLHIIAHSRGTDVVTTALRELVIEHRGAGRNPRHELKLGNVVLAAPDLDWEVAQQRLGSERVVHVPERFTIYRSEDDKAIGLAEWLFASVQRIGQLTEKDLTAAQADLLKTMPEVAIVDVQATTDFLGHGYFISNPAVLSDLILVLRDGREPGAAHGRPLEQTEGGFWVLRDGYPDPDAAARRGRRTDVLPGTRP